MIIGSGPIVIGQAAEFDYAGNQACKALKSLGLEVCLVNSNPATLMTDHEMADEIYMEPLTLRTLQRIIEKEKPDSLLSTLGGRYLYRIFVVKGDKEIAYLEGQAIENLFLADRSKTVEEYLDQNNLVGV